MKLNKFCEVPLDIDFKEYFYFKGRFLRIFFKDQKRWFKENKKIFLKNLKFFVIILFDGLTETETRVDFFKNNFLRSKMDCFNFFLSKVD